MAIDINIESQVSQTITDGVTNKAPSENAVFDALALKIGGAVSIGQVAFGTDTNVIGGDSGFTWDNTNKRLGVGISTPTARLHVQSQGALSTDIAFRVRNSANTLDLTTIQGDGVLNNIGNINVGLATGGSPRDISISGYGNNRLIFNTGYQTYGTNLISVTRRTPSGGFTDNTMLFQQGGFNDGNNVPYRHHYVNPTSYYGSNIPRDGYNAGFMWFKNTASFANLQMKLSPDNALNIYNNTNLPIETNFVNAFQLYSADIVAGNAAPHFRTENGSVIKLYKQDLPTNPTNAEIATFLSNLGLANLI